MSKQKNTNNSEEPIVEKKPISLKKVLLIPALIAATLLMSGYAMFNDDMEEASKIKKSQAISVNSQGQFVYTSTNEKNGYTKETTAKEMAKELEPSLGEYIKKTEEENVEAIEYLLGAEIVTKMPYIDNMPEGELNGNIKFYRYIKETEEENEINGEDVKEENRLKFMNLEEFNAKLEAFKTDPNSNRDIYNYFSIDEDGAVLIAYGSEENRTIQTGIESSLKDRDLTAEIINANSGENYTGNNDTGYQASKYEINTKKVDYLSLVGQYVMPANLLNSLLIHTGDIDFVTEIARLAYESEIAIGIYDNRSHYEKTQTYTYYKMLDLEIETSLNFQATLVNITNIGTPNIKLTYEDLKESPYSNIFISCKSSTNEDGKISNHEKTYITGGATGGHVENPKDMYISGTDANNKITSLGQATSFKTIYRQTRESMAMPTVGILVADTWISRWESTYTKVENNPGPTSTGDTEMAETVNIQEYANITSVLDAFEANKKANVKEELRNHESELRENTIKRIIECTPESTYKVNSNSIYVGFNTRKSILNTHISSCSRICQPEIASYGNTLGDIYYEVTDRNGKLYGGPVYNDYNVEVSEYKRRKAEKQTSDRKYEFENQLNQEGKITASQSLKGTKDYKNITQNSTTETITTRYEKTVTQTDRIKEKDGEKFSKIFNSSKFYESRQAIKTRDGWLWDYIRENEDTAKIEEILRYLLNIATKSEMFGKIENIDEILKAFDLKVQMQPAVASGKALMMDYICSFENEAMMLYLNGESAYTQYISNYITEDKTMYKVASDGYNNPTVGFGIDLFKGAYINDYGDSIRFADELIKYHGYTEEQLRDMSGATQIPVEIIDELKEKRVEQDYNKVIAETEHLNLTEYQIYALVSRNYNYNINGFLEAYKAYYDFERDDKYGENWSDRYFEHPLYTQYMSKPITAKGKDAPGLVKRRKSEWKLFLTGYMDNINKWASDNSIIECADRIHKYMEQNSYTYCVSFCNDLEECSSPSQCGRNVTFEESKTGHHKTCCATYVSWVLQEAGYITRKQHTDSAGTMKNTLEKMGWQEISSIEQAEPGDILYYSYGHIEIYAGDGTVYNAGSGNAIRDPSPKVKQTLSSVSVILRAP